MDSERSSRASSICSPRYDVSSFEISVNPSEEIQVLLLGAPGTGKTHLQTRYTLRQFVDITDQGAYRMGGHKHLRMLDGVSVHLMIHEMSGWNTDPLSTDPEQQSLAQQERCFRKRLLEKSDAVMLLFNPGSRSSFDWIDTTLIDDILEAGHERLLTHDMVKLLDGMPDMEPKRAMTTRLAATSMPAQESLQRRPDSPQDWVSLFSADDERNGDLSQQVNLDRGLKRIDSLVGGTALNSSEQDLPRPLFDGRGPRQPAPRSTTSSISDDPFDIREVRGPYYTSKQTPHISMLPNEEEAGKVRRDSAISLQSVSSTSSRYSEVSTAVDSQGESVEDFEYPDVKVVEFSELFALQEARIKALAEESKIPVMVVATMTDLLKDNGGTVQRVVTTAQGQQIARHFGSNSGYIEVSALLNANVDEAYGILVDQVMARRRLERQDSIIRAHLEREKVVELMFEKPEAKSYSTRRQRSCMPGWGWLNDNLGMPSLGTVLGSIGRALALGVQTDASHSGEDVWGESPSAQRHEWRAQPSENQTGSHTKPESKSFPGALEQRKQYSDKTGRGLQGRVMCHGPEVPGPLVKNLGGFHFKANLRQQSVLSVMSPIKYGTPLMVVNPDPPETEEPLYRPASHKLSRPNLAIEARAAAAGSARPETIDISRPKEAAGVAAYVTSSPEPSGHRVATMGASFGDALRQEQPRQESGSVRATSSASSSHRATTTADVDHRVSSKSVMFRPINHQPSEKGNRDSFVLILSPTTTTKARDAPAPLIVPRRAVSPYNNNKVGMTAAGNNTREGREEWGPHKVEGGDYTRSKSRKTIVKEGTERPTATAAAVSMPVHTPAMPTPPPTAILATTAINNNYLMSKEKMDFFSSDKSRAANDNFQRYSSYTRIPDSVIRYYMCEEATTPAAAPDSNLSTPTTTVMLMTPTLPPLTRPLPPLPSELRERIQYRRRSSA